MIINMLGIVWIIMLMLFGGSTLYIAWLTWQMRDDNADISEWLLGAGLTVALLVFDALIIMTIRVLYAVS